MFRSTTLAALVAATVAAGGFASGQADPVTAEIAKNLKADLQRSVGADTPGIRFTLVTCTLAKSRKSGRCVARFAIASQRVKGTYRVAITVNAATGMVHSRVTSVVCVDAKTGAKVEC